jgi:hypothetical protein
MAIEKGATVALLTEELSQLRKQILRIRGEIESNPDASIVMPVNAQGDLENVLRLVGDITRYTGPYSLELILVINNFPPNEPPVEIDTYAGLGLRIVSIANIREPGEAPGFTARIPGAEAALSENTIFFDADCRIPNPTVLLDWYIQQFKMGTQAAYTPVEYYDLRDRFSIRVRIWVHHFARWIKRAILRIPTIRGSNYAINRSLILRLYTQGILADDMNVGPAARSAGAKVVYNGSREMRVLTSGRMFSGGWSKLFKYLFYRLRYNMRVIPVRTNAASYTHREKDPLRRYINNRPVK